MKLFRAIPILACVLLSGCCELLGTCDDDTPNPVEPTPPVANLGKAGCYAASYNAGVGYGTQVGVSLGNPAYDQRMGQEVNIQRTFFNGVPATVWILYESSQQDRNAYASPDGHILFGYHMFYYTVQTYNELAIAGILAHEWGHRTQFVHNWPTGNPGMELEADAFSGYYMAIAKQWAWTQIQGYFANTYALGDYNFNHPQHHGTPNQRLAAAYLGVNTAIQAMQQNRPFSYQELHTLFSQQINARVVQPAFSRLDQPVPAVPTTDPLRRRIDALPLEDIAAGRTRGGEVRYPRRLQPDDILRLRPFDRTS
jgi:hypothetical protein